MSAEYSVEEVRAEAHRHGDHVADMLTAYADLLERIKADESAQAGVTDALPAAVKACDEEMQKYGHKFAGAVAGDAMRAALLAVWPNPPAQAAQETPCSLNEALAVIEAWADRGNRLDGDDAPRLRAIADRIAPTAEPVVQGEVVDVKQTAEYSYGYQQALQDTAARPRAVPAERRVVEDSALIPRHYASNIGYAACMMESSQSVLDRREAPILRKIAALLAAAPSPGESE